MVSGPRLCDTWQDFPCGFKYGIGRYGGLSTSRHRVQKSNLK